MSDFETPEPDYDAAAEAAERAEEEAATLREHAEGLAAAIEGLAECNEPPGGPCFCSDHWRDTHDMVSGQVHHAHYCAGARTALSAWRSGPGAKGAGR